MATEEQMAVQMATPNNDDEQKQDALTPDQDNNESPHAQTPSVHMDRATIFSIPSGEEDQKVTKFCNKDVKVCPYNNLFLAYIR